MKTQQFNGRALTLAMASILAVGIGAFSVDGQAEVGKTNLGVSATIESEAD